jgi:hypothetical protein
MTNNTDKIDAEKTVFYRLMESKVEAEDAINRVLATANQSLAIFDQSPHALRDRGFGRPQAIEVLRALLLGNRARMIRIALHEVREIETELPRLLTLMSQFSTQLLIHQTTGVARDAQDVMLIADQDAVWRKPVASHPRSIVSIGSEPDAKPFIERFDDIWLNTVPAVSSRATGL